MVSAVCGLSDFVRPHSYVTLKWLSSAAHLQKSFWLMTALSVLKLRPRRRDGLLGTGTEWEGDERVKARPRKPSEKLPERRRDRGPPPEQWKC